jgi:hypothetical protein
VYGAVVKVVRLAVRLCEAVVVACVGGRPMFDTVRMHGQTRKVSTHLLHLNSTLITLGGLSAS